MPWWKKLLITAGLLLLLMIVTGNGPAAAEIVKGILDWGKEAGVNIGSFIKSIFNTKA